MKVQVEAESDDVIEGRKVDSRGRVRLGPEYAGETVDVAVVEREDADEGGADE